MKTFYNLLGNTLIVTFVNNYVWFALTFWIYLMTQSVVATSILSGIYLIFTTLFGFWFGHLVDIYNKKSLLLIGNFVSCICFGVSLGIYFLINQSTNLNSASNPYLWLMIIVAMLGVTFGNLYNIIVPTMVTKLVPQKDHDKANGLFGTITGISFAFTSVASGLTIGFSNISSVFLISIFCIILGQIYLVFIDISHTKKNSNQNKEKFNILKTFSLITSIPGLLGLIIFTTFNNFLGGVFMALTDAYGLSLVSVQTWGIIFGVLSFSFIAGGLFIARMGLGKNPLRTLAMVYTVMWFNCIIFVIQPSVILLVIGMFVWMTLSPFVEAVEQTIIQRVVPEKNQGKVFGFAQSVEQSASPITAFMIGPIAQLTFIPFMTTGRGVDLIGNWFGTGPDRGIALVFITAGFIGIIATIVATKTKSYRLISKTFSNS